MRLALFLFISFFVHSQSKLNFVEDIKTSETLFVLEIAKTMNFKEKSIDSLCLQNPILFKNFDALKDFEEEINNSIYKLDYLIEKTTYESGKIAYTIHFFVLKDEEQFSKLYIIYKPLGDLMELYLMQIDNNKIIEIMKRDWYEENNMAPPPLPPYPNK